MCERRRLEQNFVIFCGKPAFWCLSWPKDGGHGGPHLQKVGGQFKKMGAPWPPLISIADVDDATLTSWTTPHNPMRTALWLSFKVLTYRLMRLERKAINHFRQQSRALLYKLVDGKHTRSISLNFECTTVDIETQRLCECGMWLHTWLQLWTVRGGSSDLDLGAMQGLVEEWASIWSTFPQSS